MKNAAEGRFVLEDDRDDRVDASESLNIEGDMA